MSARQVVTNDNYRGIGINISFLVQQFRDVTIDTDRAININMLEIYRYSLMHLARKVVTAEMKSTHHLNVKVPFRPHVLNFNHTANLAPICDAVNMFGTFRNENTE